MLRNLPANAGGTGLIPGQLRSNESCAPQPLKPAPQSPCSASGEAPTMGSPSTAAAKNQCSQEKKKDPQRKSNTSFRWFLKWDVARPPWKKKSNLGGAGGSLLVNHPQKWRQHHGWKAGASSVLLPPTTIRPPSMDILKVVGGENCQPRELYPEKGSFRNEGEIKTVPDKANLREFITTSPAS